MRQRLLLSVDFEDWHQLVRRRLGVADWQQPGPALARQTAALLELLAELEARATFFVLGMAARSHPQLVESVLAAGHEIACHGDAHLPVHSQSAAEFARDLEAACKTIEDVTGVRPIGYRAPAFSLTRDAAWAHGVLAEHGFRYDSSHHDSIRIRRRMQADATGPHRLELPGGEELWELPPAVWRAGRASLPVGGASYWALTPLPMVLEGLRSAGELAGLYLHPHELDPLRLDPLLPAGASLGQRAHGVIRAAQRNSARRRAARVLEAIASRFSLIPYGEAHAELAGDLGAGTKPVSRQGAGV